MGCSARCSRGLAGVPQGRQAHFETIGRILFDLPPDITMFAF
jgi:hypothetical protein